MSLNRNGTADGSRGSERKRANYQVTVFGISGDGTLSLSTASGTATDLAGNPAPA